MVGVRARKGNVGGGGGERQLAPQSHTTAFISDVVGLSNPFQVGTSCVFPILLWPSGHGQSEAI